jgi:putative mRNA 3-end processing factor
MVKSMHPVTYGAHTVDGLEIGVHPAGHIPGSAMYLVDQTLFTGDMNTNSTRLLVGAKPISCDTLVIEGTYVGREHPDRQQTEQRFLGTIKEVVDRGGLAVVPAFAVGRTQELLLLLQGKGYDVRLDGMGNKATQIMLDHPEYLRQADALARAFEAVRVVRSDVDRKHALDADVVVTTSGMLDGGPVFYYLQRVKDGPKSAVLLTGYQVEGTNGRRLLETGTVDRYGVVEKINCQIDFFDFSAHAGHEDLVQFIYACQPKSVVLFHSEHAPQLAEELADLDVYTPKNGETLEL